MVALPSDVVREGFHEPMKRGNPAAQPRLKFEVTVR